MSRHLLTDLRIRKAKPKRRPYRLSDGDGLYLWISPSGVKSWQLRYRWHGSEQVATLGRLERLSLAEARAEAEAARGRIGEGEHFTIAKRVAKIRCQSAAQTFGAVAAAWVARESRTGRWSTGYRQEVEASLRRHLGVLGALPIKQITAPVVTPELARIERSAPHMFEKVRPRLHAIMDYAVEHSLIAANPLAKPRRRRRGERRHFPAVTDLKGLGEILRAARAADPCKGIARAHLLLAFTALRVSEVIGAKWEEFALDGIDVPVSGHVDRLVQDLHAGNWSVPRERMRRKDAAQGAHVVPLPPRLLATLRDWRAADGPGVVYVCPAPRDSSRPITPEGVEKFYRNVLGLGGKHSPHSWRSAFSAISLESGKDGDAVEAQLDHIVGASVNSAYARAKRLELRRELMRWYEGQLLAARDGTGVLSIENRSK